MEALDITLVHAWGMTETSPLGTLGKLRSQHDSLKGSNRLAQQSKQGSAVPLIEFRLVDDSGKACPWDGKAVGEVQGRLRLCLCLSPS